MSGGSSPVDKSQCHSIVSFEYRHGAAHEIRVAPTALRGGHARRVSFHVVIYTPDQPELVAFGLMSTASFNSCVYHAGAATNIESGGVSGCAPYGCHG